MVQCGIGIDAAPTICLLLDSWTNTLIVRFSRFHSRLSFTEALILDDSSGLVELASPTLCIQRATDACRRFFPAFSPRSTSECRPFSVMTIQTSPADAPPFLMSTVNSRDRFREVEEPAIVTSSFGAWEFRLMASET